MYKIVILIIVTLSLISCNNKSIQLPQITISGESEIQNHSQIWVFYKEADTGKIEADLNLNNKITTTHWIINIDKRLTLNELVPVFQLIKEKRETKTAHSKEGMLNYLSYSDTKDEKIALFAMDSIQFAMQSKEKLAELIQSKSISHTVIFSNEKIQLDKRIFSIDQWNNLVLDTLSKESIQLQYSKDLSYQKYLEYRLSIQSKLPEGMRIEQLEYVIQ